MSKRQFSGKNILITGAAGNLGSQLCLVFGKAGANILALDLKEEAIEVLSKELGAAKIPFYAQACDITNPDALQKAIADGRKALGPIDVLVNNAGITHIRPFAEVDNPDKVLRKVMEVNLFAPVMATQCLIKDLIENKGLIINISSVAGFAPLLGRTAYAASKHALHGYFESLRNEYIEQGLQCLMVCPSFIGADPHRVDISKTDEYSIYQQKKPLDYISPQVVALRIFRAASRNKARLIVGKAARIAYWLRRFFPSWYEKVMRKRV